MNLITIALDAMGGDNAPGAVCEGAILALRERPGIKIRLYGPKEALEPLVASAGDCAGRVEIVHAPDVIGMHDAPALAIRKKTESSMVMGLLALKNGEVDAFVSAGSTGALLVGGMTRVGRIRGIDRPALTPIIPTRTTPFLLIDSGANVDCIPKYLNQFGLMGSVYMSRVQGIASPRVGLVNIGAEPEKGSALYKEAHQLMAAQGDYNFTGNVEARDIMAGAADVIVADGFDGNLILKHTEGLAKALTGMLKDELMGGGLLTKIGALLVKPAMKNFKKRLDYEEHGGAPLLGVNGAIIKAHGSSSPKAFAAAIGQAEKMVAGRVVEEIRSFMDKQTDQNNA